MNSYGVKKTTLDDIASAAGMSTPSLYYYFKNKNEVVREVLSVTLNSARRIIDMVIHAGAPPEAQLKLLAQAFYASIKQAPFVMNIDNQTKSEVVIVARDLIDIFNRDLAAMIENILKAGNKTGAFVADDYALTAETMTSCLWGVLEKAAGTLEIELLEKKIDSLLTLFVYGLKKR
jgi:AcrR family transcriptional regulator